MRWSLAAALADFLLTSAPTRAEQTARPGGRRYAQFHLEPFINYNFGHGWFLSSAPIITDEEVRAGRKWTVPVGAVAGRIIKLGRKLPVKLSFGGYYNVVTPQYGARWQLQSVAAVIF